MIPVIVDHWCSDAAGHSGGTGSWPVASLSVTDSSGS